MKVAGVAVIAAITAIVAAIVKIGDAAIDAATKFDDSMAKLPDRDRRDRCEPGSPGRGYRQSVWVVSGRTGNYYYRRRRPEHCHTVSRVMNWKRCQRPILVNCEGHWRGCWLVRYRRHGKCSTSLEFRSRKQSEYLSYFEDVSQSSGVKFDQLISLLAAGDRGFQLLGFNAKQSADAIGQAVKKDGVTAAQELVSALEMGLSKMAGTSEAALKSAETALGSGEQGLC